MKILKEIEYFIKRIKKAYYYRDWKQIIPSYCCKHSGLYKIVCHCSWFTSPKWCPLHSCPCGCDMSIADELYQYFHSDLKDRYTLEDYILMEKEQEYIDIINKRLKENMPSLA